MIKQLTLNSQEAAYKFEKDSVEFVKVSTISRKKAREVLVDLGIYTPEGVLTKRYRE